MLTGVQVLEILRKGGKIKRSIWGYGKFITTKRFFGGVIRVVNEKGNILNLDITPLLNDGCTDFIEIITKELKVLNKYEAIRLLLEGKNIYLQDGTIVKLSEDKNNILLNNELILIPVIQFVNDKVLCDVI